MIMRWGDGIPEERLLPLYEVDVQRFRGPGSHLSTKPTLENPLAGYNLTAIRHSLKVQ